MPDPINAERLHDLRLLTQVAVSPDGDRVAFVADEFDPDADERRNGLYVAPTDGSRDPHRLTRASSASAPAWGPDGERLGFLAARDDDEAALSGRDDDDAADGDDESERDDDSDDEPRTQVWAFDLARGGDARQLTDFEEGVREFDWGPDGDRVVVSARDPTDEEQAYLERRREDDGPIEVTRLQHKRDGAGWLDDVTTYLFVADVPASGERVDRDDARRLDDAYGAGTSEPLWGMQPRWGPTDRIAFGTCDAERPDDSAVVDLFTIAPDGTDRRKHTDGTHRVAAHRWSPSGDRIAFAAGNPTNWYEPTEVFVTEVDATDDDAESDAFHSISASLDRTLGWPGTPEWADEDTVVTAVADEAWCRLVALDADRDDPERVFGAQGRGRNCEAFDLAGGTVVVGLATPDHPPDCFAVDADALVADGDAESIRLTDLNADEMADLPTPESRRVTYENGEVRSTSGSRTESGDGDGDEVEAIAYLPPDFDPATDDPTSLVVSIHGGPMSYDAPTFEFKNALWTSRGHVVLKPNYRGSTSYGREWAERLKGSRGELESDDVVSGARHLVDEGWVDPDRLFCTGFSYGGITTAHVVTRADDFAAAAPEHGIYDFYANFGTDDNHTWHEWEFGMPWENLETYRDISSITDVGEIDTPMLITAGEEDWRCPPTQAEQLYVSVRKQGVDAKLVIYPNEHHNVGKPERAAHRLRELTTWFDSHDPAVESEAPE